jgi:hypothetical protein
MISQSPPTQQYSRQEPRHRETNLFRFMGRLSMVLAQRPRKGRGRRWRSRRRNNMKGEDHDTPIAVINWGWWSGGGHLGDLDTSIRVSPDS